MTHVVLIAFVLQHVGIDPYEASESEFALAEHLVQKHRNVKLAIEEMRNFLKPDRDQSS